MDFELFNSDEAKNGAIGLQVVGPERLSKKSENRLETVLTSRSLNLKKSEFLKCGDVVSRKVSLKEDLVCDGVPNADAALTLDGPGAELNCKGFKIVQSEGDASTCEALNEYEGHLEIDTGKVEDIKDEAINGGCGLSFLYGIKLLNGAKAVGCDIRNFLVGAYVGQGAKELSDVTVLGNTYGVVVETNKKVKITDITAKDNGQLGILASNDGTSVFVNEYTPGGSIELKKITASGNGDNGIEVQGSKMSIIDTVVTGNLKLSGYSAGISIKHSDKIDLKNVNAEDNLDGIVIFNSHEIDLENIYSHDNIYGGILIRVSENIKLKEITASNNDRGNGIWIIRSDVISIINTAVTGNYYAGILFGISDKIGLKNITANDNILFGIGFSGPWKKLSCTLENIQAKKTSDAIDFGMVSAGIQITDCSNLEMSWKGSISLDENKSIDGIIKFGGLSLLRTEGTITISGELTVDNNEEYGILVEDYSHVTLSIAEGSSFSACGNGDNAIDVDDSSSFTVAMAGDGTGTCVVGSTRGLTLPSQCGSCPAP